MFRCCGMASMVERLERIVLQDWARILAKANRTSEACEVYERLAGVAMNSPGGGGQGASHAARAAQMCLLAIQATGMRSSQHRNLSGIYAFQKTY